MNELYVLNCAGGDGFLNDFVLVVASSQEEAEKLIGERSVWIDESDFNVEEFDPNKFRIGIIYDMHEDEEE